MLRMFISPGRYVQGAGAAGELGKYLSVLGGSRALVIADPIGIRAIGDELRKGLEKRRMPFLVEEFRGECCRSEITRLREAGSAFDADIVVGVGGGKTIDVAKAVAHDASLPLAVVPTIAATDAPCSALSVIYTPEGVFESFLVLPKNPDLVLVDTAVIARAPVRLFVSGMGDALSTWLEADTSYRTGSPGMQGTVSTLAAQGLARLCYETIMENGCEAKLAVQRGVATEAVERVVEANTLLSGIGFESGGLAAAHSFQDGVTVLEETHRFYHGEKVAFGVIFQLVLENRPRALVDEVLNFCLKVGLPVTLEEIGLADASEEQIRAVAEATAAPNETIHSEPFQVTPERVYAAIIGADALGRAAKAKR
ncbi:MAG: glycerol dehydrogenase [Synergistales bacterium]|jgi:glycerol dehydrogenase